MKRLYRSQICSNLMLKVTACILGFLCWLKISHKQTITCTLPIPLSFYNTQNNSTINAPETMPIGIRATRAQLYAFDPQKVAIHIDVANLQPGMHNIAITSEKLFLPDGITMVHCMPCNVEIL